MNITIVGTGYVGLVVGVAYKKDIDDIRESPALDVIRLLEEKGARVDFHDPFIASFREEGRERRGVSLDATSLGAADAVVIVTDHTGIDYQALVDGASLVVDTRNATARTRPSRARVVSLSSTSTAPGGVESLPAARVAAAVH